ncbi:MAG: ABC transporter ATP-binding protein [Burkholderiaceae bacterium]|nr:ABC transporter ATP-binding protein [Burkholderiaceae bacterium]
MQGKDTPVLRIDAIAAHYGPIRALEDVSLTVNAGQIVALVGANGAGKTTLLRTISGLQKASAGRVVYEGRDITTLKPAARVAQGIVQVPEGRQMFGPMSVEDNLLLGGYTRPQGKALQDDLERMYEMFPILREKRRLPAATLSGGQQQMLALTRALMARPRLLLLDEPSMGLAPLIVAEIFRTIGQLKEEGMTILLVEQNASVALAIADHGYVMETGSIVMSGEGRSLLENEDVKRAYLGI